VHRIRRIIVTVTVAVVSRVADRASAAAALAATAELCLRLCRSSGNTNEIEACATVAVVTAPVHRQAPLEVTRAPRRSPPSFVVVVRRPRSSSSRQASNVCPLPPQVERATLPHRCQRRRRCHRWLPTCTVPPSATGSNGSPSPARAANFFGNSADGRGRGPPIDATELSATAATDAAAANAASADAAAVALVDENTEQNVNVAQVLMSPASKFLRDWTLL
jgi:hypothetical protein